MTVCNVRHVRRTEESWGNFVNTQGHSRFWETVERLRNGFLLLALVLVIGTIGYTWFDGVTVLEGLYGTILVVSTLGFGDYTPDRTSTLLLTIFLILAGVGTVYYLLGTFAETLIVSSLGTQQQRRLERQIAAMNNHYIVCGYGMVGRHVVRELADEEQPFVIIDTDDAMIERARADGHAAVLGDATEERVLHQAGIDRAGGLLATTDGDATNVLIILTARDLNDTLHIVARASSETTEPKMLKAGADRVLAPAVIGGQRMAALALRPTTVDVLMELIETQNRQSWMDETTLDEHSPLIGNTLASAQIHQRTGATVIAIRHGDGRIVANPTGDEPFQPGDVLVSVGSSDQLEQLVQVAKPAAEHHISEEDTGEIVGTAQR
jgi:voltage-gated potassium channel